MGDRAGGSRLVTAGRVGRPHGLDGSFKVADPAHDLARGTHVVVGDRTLEIRVRRGTADRPIVALAGVEDREAAAALSGELLLVEEADLPLEAGEWLAADLVGCEVTGLGVVRRVIDAPSCDVLELEDGSLVPLVHDALVAVDLESKEITVDLAFLGRETSS